MRASILTFFKACPGFVKIQNYCSELWMVDDHDNDGKDIFLEKLMLKLILLNDNYWGNIICISHFIIHSIIIYEKFQFVTNILISA